MGGTMVTLTALIFITAIFLLCWYFFVPGAKELFDEENKKKRK
jgi:cbb3-type cytochrome oxidase subunit 3